MRMYLVFMKDLVSNRVYNNTRKMKSKNNKASTT